MILVLCASAFLEIISSAGGFKVSRVSQHPLETYRYVEGNRNGYRIYSSVFDEEEVRAMNPPVPPPPPKKPAIYDLKDDLAKYRFTNFQESGVDTHHFGSLPYVEFRYQDKGSLVGFKNVAEIVSTYSNKLITLLSNFQEWTGAFNAEGNGVEDLSFYNPLSPDSYYAVVFYCAWHSESIALKRAVHQLCGRYTFLRDPPVTNKPKPPDKLEDMIAKIEEVNRRHKEMIEEAREKGLPDPPPPPLVEREQATMKMRSINTELTGRILDHLHEHYNYRWWMSKVGHLKYNKVMSRAYSELYNTTYKAVRTEKTRHAYKLSNRTLHPPPTKWYLGDGQNIPPNMTRVNLILVRLANSMMLSNTARGLQRMRTAAHAHEKEMHFNEIIMRLLIDNGMLYKNMPVIQLFKCVNPVDKVPPVFNSKRHELLKFDMYTPFYKPDPFDIARHTLYGLPTLRKCSHLAIADDFEYLGSIMDIADLETLPSMDKLIPSGEEKLAHDFHRLFKKNDQLKGSILEDMEKLKPFLDTLELMYKMNFKQIVDARPVPVVYKYLNP
ncbi:hypothetical protein BgAZ_400120 [Babesia gibsoni]|uniref:Uncharacterized protein n=1 Tax=Babesia gibsoni TaxID=33632 RepID=A0AAD8LI19_BABGI|nr:hypothetical protein BgAZ_400120 [Babesia gibsoni]